MTLPDALKVAGPRGKVRLPGRYAVAAADLPALELTDAARLSTAWEACPEPTPEPERKDAMTDADERENRSPSACPGPTAHGPWTPAAADPPGPGLYLVRCQSPPPAACFLMLGYWYSNGGWEVGRPNRVTHWTPLPPPPDETA